MAATDRPLAGLSVLVLEDDYYLADDARHALETAGAKVVGPCPAATEALALAQQEPVQCAIVDINLGGGPDFDAARALVRKGVPVVLVTGYDHDIVPDDLRHVPCLPKPVSGRMLVMEVARTCGP